MRRLFCALAVACLAGGLAAAPARIWIRDRGHAGLPDHWDAQGDGGEDYFRVDANGEERS